MPKRKNWVLFSGICAALVFVLGCSLDSSSDISDNADAVFGQESANVQQALSEPPPQQQSSSSSSPSVSSSSSSGGGGSGGFVWKPVSEGDGNLVVLLPPSLTGKVAGVKITKGGKTLEQGRPTGVHNGGREHFRFSAPGAAYGSGLKVVVQLKNGSTQTFSVPNGGQRVG